MKDNEFIRFGDELPRLGKTIEVLKDNGELIKNIQGKVCYNGDGVKFKNLDIPSKSFNIHRLSGWRYQSEKRPDFSRLNFHDYIVVDFSLNKITFEKYSGWFSQIKEDFLHLSGRDSLFIDVTALDIKYIKKITRINLEEKTFEEI